MLAVLMVLGVGVAWFIWAHGPDRADVPDRFTSAHYFGRHWAKNVLFGYRREELALDLALMREDGFNSVVYLVAWGDFQTVAQPCCTYDERAFERLDQLIVGARDAGLQVILRVGYAWSFHAVDASLDRQQALMNDPAMRQAYLDFGRRIGERYGSNPAVRMSFLTWEDHQLQEIQAVARETWTRFLSMEVGVSAARAALGPVSRLDDAVVAGPLGPAPRLFHRYWDWLKRDELYLPMSLLIPRLSYEVRIDKDPLWSADASKIDGWADHYRTFDLPGAPVTTLYWAPFWGAANQGEELSAERALTLLDFLLIDTSRHARAPWLYIDQFNFIDNTPGFERHAVIDPDAMDDFLGHAVCALRRHPVQGFGPWTWQEYFESPLHNPSFVLGLEGWTIDADPVRLIAADTARDSRVKLESGGRIRQEIQRTRGRLPGEGGHSVEACVRASLDTPARLRISDPHGSAELQLVSTDSQQLRCIPLPGARVEDQAYFLGIEAQDGDAELLAVYVHDHRQRGALRDHSARPLGHLQAYRVLNTDFLAERIPKRCESWRAAPP